MGIFIIALVRFCVNMACVGILQYIRTQSAMLTQMLRVIQFHIVSVPLQNLRRGDEHRQSVAITEHVVGYAHVDKE